MWGKEGRRKFCGTLHLHRDGGDGAVEAASPHRVELVLLWQRWLRLRRLLVVARVPGQCHALSTATRWLLPIAAGELRRLADDHAPPLVPLRRCNDFPRRGDCFGVALLGDNSTE